MMRTMFVAACHISAAVAYVNGVRSQRWHYWSAPDHSPAEHMVDLLAFFVNGGDLWDAYTRSLFAGRRAMADSQRALSEILRRAEREAKGD